MSHKVLHVVLNLNVVLGGSVRAACEIASCIKDGDSVQTVVGTMESDPQIINYFKDNYANVEFIGFSYHFPRHSYASFKLLLWLLRNVRKYDIIHIHGLFTFPHIFAIFVSIIKKKPFIISPHNSLDPYDLRKKYFLKKYLYGPIIVRKAIEKCSSIHCTTEREAETLVTFSNDEYKNKIKVLGLPVSFDNRKGTTSFRDKYKIDKNDYVVLFISRLDPKKGLDILFEAITQIDDPKMKLIIAGDGNKIYKKKLKILVNTLGIENKVVWTGFLTAEDKIGAFCESDLFILPSFNENFGIVVVEAMYFILPIIVSDQVYLSTLLEKSDAAIICRTDPDDIREKLMYAMKNKDVLKRIALNANKVGLENFSKENLSIHYKKYYEELIKYPRRSI